MKRIFDLTLAVAAVAFLSVPILFVAVLVRVSSPGPVIYWSVRIGKNNREFKMPKFRTMTIDAPTVATHLLENPDQFLTPIGSALRKSSLDELPQLWSILAGDMSFVGPRPALFNQYDLAALRTANGIQNILPGLTGWAQVNGRDELSLDDKVRFELEYLRKQSIGFDLKILLLTFRKVLIREGITH